MRFKNHHKYSSIPEINLVPMMDVLMSVLTFFIIISMSFTTQITADVNLPQATTLPTNLGENGEGVRGDKTLNPLVIGLNQQGQILLADQPVNQQQMTDKIASYLKQNPQGVVILKADRKLSYKKVEELLNEMQKLGGDRISLALE